MKKIFAIFIFQLSYRLLRLKNFFNFFCLSEKTSATLNESEATIVCRRRRFEVSLFGRCSVVVQSLFSV